MDIDRAKEIFKEKVQSEYLQFLGKKLTETDTRCKLIDSILKDVLGWKENQITREPHISENGRYIDYILHFTQPYFIIEAKSNHINFDLPANIKKKKYKVGGVISENKALKEALIQARDYANTQGVVFCCVTNGHQYVFFRAHNSEGILWDNQQAIIFRNFEDIISDFKTFYDLLSYNGMSNGLLNRTLPVTESSQNALKQFQFFNIKQSTLERTRERNLLFPYLRDIIRRVFQSLDSEEESVEILEHCYVESARESSYERGLGDLLKDQTTSLSERVEKIKVSKKDASNFQKQVQTSIDNLKPISEVLLILGGVGAGKTTFIQRFRKVLSKNKIDDDCIWAYVNFNKFSDTGESLLEWVSTQIFESIELDYKNIDFDSWDMLKQIYRKEFEKLRKGTLAPLWENNRNKFDEKFSEKIEKLSKQNDKHILRVLKTASERYKKRIFLVFDNADQFDAETQNNVFLIAQKMAEELKCSSIISLREESYWKNKDYGALSAFHAISYHVQAPRLEQVISKRFKYAKKLIRDEHFFNRIRQDGDSLTVDELEKIFDLLKATILGNDKRFIEFAEYLSPGEVRRPLEFIARFLYSGHTNMNSLLKAVREKKFLTIGFHEYITAIILGDREYFVDENSDLINIFAVDGDSDACHFNRLFFIERLIQTKNETSEFGLGYIPISQLISDANNVGIQPETSSSILSILIRKRLLQTETKIREDIRKSKFVRATSAAQYYIDYLCNEFAYLDCIITDIPVKDGEFFTKMQKLSDRMENEHNRLHRLQFRLDRTKLLIDYLKTNYKTSLMCKNKKSIDKPVSTMIEEMDKKFSESRKQIYKKAKQIFNK